MTYSLEQLKRNWRADLHPEHLMDASGVISELFQELEARDRSIILLEQSLVLAQEETAQACAEIAESHVEHGEFVHGGRYECADAIAEEIRAKYGVQV